MKETSRVNKLKSIMDLYLEQIRSAVADNGLGEREKLFLKLLAVLTNSVQLHFELQELEKNERLMIPKRKMKKIQNTYFKALSMFMELTSPTNSSLYELSVIMAISDVVSAHEENVK
jgi:hypothetical protein